LAACTKSEAELTKDDRTKIDAIVAEDMKASKAMAEADAASRTSNVALALQAIDGKAKPAIEAGLKAAKADFKTAWGRAHRDTLARILEDRRAELGPYAEAVKSGDAEKLVGAIGEQAKIERRAMAAIDELGR
jgi:hypothetical protein